MSIQESVYQFWCFICLYTLGFIYLLVELNRRFQLFYKVRKLDLNRDLDIDLSKNVVVITGGNSGIGLHTAQQLIKRGAHVIITTCVQPGSEFDLLFKQLSDYFKNLKGSFELWYLELTSFNSVIAFIERFRSSGLPLNILINNAGVMFAPFKLTQDNFESHFQINYLSHCLITWSLLPILNDTGRSSDKTSRIVNVSSSTHYARNINLKDLQGLEVYSRYHAYAQSKLALIMFTYRLHNYLTSKKIGANFDWITVNCLHPGVVLTNLYCYVDWVTRFPRLAKLLFRKVEEGTETVLFTAISPELDEVGGKYLEDSAITKSSKQSYDQTCQNELWDKTFNYLQPYIEKLKLDMPIDYEVTSY